MAIVDTISFELGALNELKRSELDGIFLSTLWVIWFKLHHLNFEITSIVPISIHWELQLKERHGLIPNETLQAGLDEISWKHGCGKVLYSVISKCVR